MSKAKRVAVIGAGPAGAITIDALAQEKIFDVIRVFERREGPGGCWIEDEVPPPFLTDFSSLAARTADKFVEIPTKLPAQTPKITQARFAESSIYPYLETNVDSLAMEFSQESIPEERSARSISIHGNNTPFRPWQVMKKYVTSLIERKGYPDLISYNTTVERAEKVGSEWKLTLRKEGVETDSWWVEWFDAVVVASGHFSVPYIPSIEGLEELEKSRPGSVLHSKQYRGREAYRNKRIIVVGASVSAADIAVDLAEVAKTPVHAVIKGHKANMYFGDIAFKHPGIMEQPSISHVSVADGERTVHFVDGTSAKNVDHIIFGTGYSWSLPFLPDIQIRNNRIPDLYQHVVYQHDPTLCFIGAVGAGLTFKIYEWQAVLTARLLAGRASLPSLTEQQEWEQERIKKRGDGPGFTVVFPEFEEYFETVRELAGKGENGLGRQLPPFRREWVDAFMSGIELRKDMWRRKNTEAEATLLSLSKVKL